MSASEARAQRRHPGGGSRQCRRGHRYVRVSDRVLARQFGGGELKLGGDRETLRCTQCGAITSRVVPGSAVEESDETESAAAD